MKKIFLAIIILIFSSSLAIAAGSRSFDGLDDEVDFGNNHNVTTNSVSFGGWGKMTEDASFDNIIGKRASGTNAGYAIIGLDTDLMQCTTADGTDQATAASSADNDGAWTFYVCTWNGSTQTVDFYENGVLAGTDTDTAVGSITNAVALKVGETSDNLFDTNGLISYAFVEKSAVLTEVEYLEIMWKPDMMEIYDFFAPLWGDSTEIDLSSGTLTGTVTNATTSQDGPPVMFGEGLPL